MDIRKLQEQRTAALEAAEAITALADTEDREITEDERSAVDTHIAKVKQLAGDIKRSQELEAARAAEEKVEDRVAPPNAVEQATESRVVVPSHIMRYGRLRAFTQPEGEEKAYRFGIWGASALLGLPWAHKRREELGGLEIRRDTSPEARAANEGTNTAGGFLVPNEFMPTIILLRETFGRFRPWVNIEPMASDTASIQRQTGDLSAFYVGEGVSGTESQLAFDQVNLVAKKLMILTKRSSEVNEDAIIDWGDKLAREVAHTLAKKEDTDGFTAVGAGGATDAGIVGVGPAITNINGVDEGGGVILGAGDKPNELTLKNFNDLIGILPEFADNDNTAFFCHRTVWAQAMQRLEAAAGGNTITELKNGMRIPQYLGYPVVRTSVMATGTAVSQVLVLLGDLSLAATLGDRRSVTIAVSTDALNAFEEDQLVLKATSRIDIVVHDVGTATVAGPVVALVGKAS